MRKLKAERNTIILTSVLILLPVLAGVLLWNRLPEQIPTHFGFNGEPDSWSSRTFTVFFLPLFLLAIHLLCATVTAYDPKEKGVSDRMYRLVLWLVPLISNVIFSGVYGIALGYDINISLLTRSLLGFMFIVIGNYMPKVRQNMTVGIKIPWTLADPENWNKTHRLGGYMFMLAGFIMLASLLLPDKYTAPALFVSIFAAAFVPMIYSFLLYRKTL